MKHWRGELVKPIKLDYILEDRKMYDKLEKISPEKLIEKNKGELLTCWKCHKKFLDLSEGSHICEL